MRGRVLPAVAIAFGLGVCCGNNFGIRAAFVVIAPPIAVWAWRARSPLSILLLALATGAARPYFVNLAQAPLPQARTTLVGRVAAVPQSWDRGSTLILEATSPIHGDVRLRILDGTADVLPGDLVAADVRLRPPRGFRNPGAFDTEKALRAHGIVAIASIASPANLQVRERGTSGLLRTLARVRSRMAAALDQRLLGVRRAVIGALTLGDRGAIPEDVEIAFRRAGVTHLLSVSGLHMAAIVLLLYGALRRAFASCGPLPLFVSVRSLAALAALPFAATYALLCGGAVPVVRAAIVAGALLVAALLRRVADGPSALALAALLLLALDPTAIEQPAFQLSFAACVGLLLAPRWRRRGPIGWLGNLASMTASASLITAPIVAWHFGQVSLIGIVANFVCVPLTTAFLLPASLAGLLLSAVWDWGADVVLRVAGHAAFALVECARLFSYAPLAAIQTGCPTKIEGALALGAAILLLRARFRWALTFALMLSGATAIDAIARQLRSSMLVTFIDVGQGDAILVELPKNRSMLVDGGGSFEGGPDIGKAALLPVLRKKRIFHLDVVALSHPHPDHFGGLRAVLEELSIGEFWTTGEPSAHPAYLQLLEALERHRVPQQRPRPFSIGAARVEVLHPLPGYAEALSTNDNSLVLRLSVASRSLLLTGDLESEGEIIVAAERPLADILKVPHHGSRTSSSEALLEAVRPHLAVASLGLANRYGFPHPEVVKRYGNHAILLVRTDREGAIVAHLKREGGTIETFERGALMRW